MKFSIITINFNNRDGLRKTIESVVNQTFRDFEYIIIDGGSTDGSVEVIKEYADRINHWVSEPDKGIYNAMNKGILKAHGEYLNFMNSGDCFFDKERLQKIINLNCDSDIIVGQDLHIDSQSGKSATSILSHRLGFFHFYTTTIPHQSAFIKRQLFTTNLYNENFKIISDWAFYLQNVIFNGCSITAFHDIVALCEERGACNDAEKSKKEREQIINKYFPIGLRDEFKMLSEIGEPAYNDILFISQHKKLKRICMLFLKVSVKLYKLLIKQQ